MPLNKPSGNMYEWAYTINFLGGRCRYNCSYCYVADRIAPWLKGLGNPKYYGASKLIEKEFQTKLEIPKNYVVFVCSCSDLFGYWIPDEWILRVLDRCCDFPETTFLFQTKNTQRLIKFLDVYPPNTILGTTLESDIDHGMSKAPAPYVRFWYMKILQHSSHLPIMINIEPVMTFTFDNFMVWIHYLKPQFVSLGADSGSHNLPEPSASELERLIKALTDVTEVRLKNNLVRLLQ